MKQMPSAVDDSLHSDPLRAVGDIIGKVDQELRETALGGRIVPKNRRKGSIPQGFGEALSQGLACAAIITQAGEHQ